jgi:hypothetical protein
MSHFSKPSRHLNTYHKLLETGERDSVKKNTLIWMLVRSRQRHHILSGHHKRFNFFQKSFIDHIEIVDGHAWFALATRLTILVAAHIVQQFNLYYSKWVLTEKGIGFTWPLTSWVRLATFLDHCWETCLVSMLPVATVPVFCKLFESRTLLIWCKL